MWGFVLAAATSALFHSSIVGAQAWLPPQGEGWISFGYGNTFATKHYFGVIDPGEIDAGHMRGESVGLQLGYGVTDHFTLSVGIPFVLNKYYCGPPERTTEGTSHPDLNFPFDPANYRGIDDGSTTELSRTSVSTSPTSSSSGEVSVAPFATAVIPSHSYVYFAHSAPGRDLHQYLLGFSAGAQPRSGPAGQLRPGSYDYAFVEPSARGSTSTAATSASRSDTSFRS